MRLGTVPITEHKASSDAPERHPAEEIMLGMVEVALPGRKLKPPRRLPSRLYGYILHISMRQQIVLSLLTVVVAGLAMVPLELQRRIIDDAITPGNERLLVILALAYLAFAIFSGLLKFMRSVYQGRLSEGVIRSLRKRLTRHKFGPGDPGEGSVVSMVSAEAEQLGGFVGESIGFPLLQGGTLLSVVGYMLFVEPLIALVALAFFIPSLLLAPWIQRRLNLLVERRTTRLRELGDIIAEDLDDGADTVIDEIYRLRKRIFVLKYLAKFVNNLVGHLGPIAVLGFGGSMSIAGQTELGVLVAFVTGFEKIMDPARQLLDFYRRAAQMRVQYRLIVDAVRAGGGAAPEV